MTHDGTSLRSRDVPSEASAEGQNGNGVGAVGSGQSAVRGARLPTADLPTAELPTAPPPTAAPRFPRDPFEHFVEAEWCSERLFETVGFVANSEWRVANGGLRRHSPLAIRPPLILDPAAGFGHIPKAARAAGYRAVGTDLVQRAPGVRGGRDFLSPHYRAPRALPTADCRLPLSIVCNPPFSKIREFVEKALRTADFRVAMLVPTHRLNAMERWLPALPLIWTLYLTPRPSMWPGWKHAELVARGEPLRNGRQDFAWLVFEVGGAFEGRTGWVRR